VKAPGRVAGKSRGPFEWSAIVLVFVPLLQPIIMAMKIDMLWFATLIAVNLQTAFLSPPVAMSAYYLKGVAPNWSLGDIYRSMGQFMVLQLIGLAVPALTVRQGAAALEPGSPAAP
jgi:TRAP-type mannitol/chloroaromatic compound transport system permease large subunit